MKNRIILNPQEEEGNFSFKDVEQYMTKGFQQKFGILAPVIALTSLQKILETYPNNADYFQTFIYKDDFLEIKYWCINDIEHITFLLPEEY